MVYALDEGIGGLRKGHAGMTVTNTGGSWDRKRGLVWLGIGVI